MSFNCDCDDQNWDSDTLLNLRRRLLLRLGYAVQVNNPPPGMAALLDDFLASGQRYLYQKYAALRQERFFSWTMVPGERFYNFEDTTGTCLAQIKSDRILWAGVEDDNHFWSPLVCGIPPEYYTSVMQPGFPCRYEIRQCIEVFPAPDKAYTLRIKAISRLDPFAEDSDTTSIDAELVFLWALANAKNHYRHADAGDIAAQANTFLSTLVAGKHLTNRYVPQSYPLPAEPKPVFIPLQNP